MIIFKRGANQPRLKLWYRGEEVLIKKVLHLTHKENIKKTREAVTPSVNTVKLCASKYYIERSVQKLIQNWKKAILIILEIL